MERTWDVKRTHESTLEQNQINLPPTQINPLQMSQQQLINCTFLLLIKYILTLD